MNVEIGFLKSKVGKRIFALFILCALIPISALASYSYINVRNQLWRQSADRMYRTSKSAGMALYERLLFLEGKLDDFVSDPNNLTELASVGAPGSLQRYFKGVGFFGGNGTKMTVIGNIDEAVEASLPESSHIAQGKTLLMTRRVSPSETRIIMIRKARSDVSASSLIMAELNPDFLFETVSSDKLPSSTVALILDASNNILFSAIKRAEPLPRVMTRALSAATSGQFDWEHEGTEYYAGFWSIFLEPAFATPMWKILLSEEASHTLEPIASFKNIFPLVVFLSFLIIMLLSYAQIKRNLAPSDSYRG